MTDKDKKNTCESIEGPGREFLWKSNKVWCCLSSLNYLWCHLQHPERKMVWHNWWLGRYGERFFCKLTTYSGAARVQTIYHPQHLQRCKYPQDNSNTSHVFSNTPTNQPNKIHRGSEIRRRFTSHRSLLKRTMATSRRASRRTRTRTEEGGGRSACKRTGGRELLRHTTWIPITYFFLDFHLGRGATLPRAYHEHMVGREPGRWAAGRAVSSPVNRNHFQGCKASEESSEDPREWCRRGGFVEDDDMCVHCPSPLPVRLFAVTHELRHGEILSVSCSGFIISDDISDEVI